MIDLTGDKNASDRLVSICRNKNREAGQWIIYAEGNFSSNINQTAVGKAAYELSQSGLVRLFQKRISDEPRRYVYLAEVV